jgi:hypothetical protein
MAEEFAPFYRGDFMSRCIAFIYSWGVVFLFVFLCLGSYAHAAKKKSVIYASLNNRYLSLLEKRQFAWEEQEELQKQINSQSDPLWIQLMLMKGLGLVPEGQTKVYFHEE